MKIAVIGSGISGLSAAYYLSKKYKVDLFEKENQFGGHANTVKVTYGDKKEVAVDIGFMVFNKKTYPNLINFFLENKIDNLSRYLQELNTGIPLWLSFILLALFFLLVETLLIRLL